MKEKLKLAIREFELPLLAFPIIVTCIVALGFIFKCPCSALQWWVACALTIGLVWMCGHDKKVSALVTAFITVGLGILWFSATHSITPASWDGSAYHQPGIRMIVDGWNPVWQCTPDGITYATGLQKGEYALWHIISMPKAVWYFCASAYKFTDAHFNLYLPISIILGCSLLYALYFALRQFGKATVAAVSLVVLFCLTREVPLTAIVDRVIAFSAVGLLATMLHCLKSGEWNWSRLFCFTFWMIVSKQTSLLQCTIFWGMFALMLLLLKRKNTISRIFTIGCVSFMLFFITCISPYLTSWINYSHPLYPRYSCDEAKYPTSNITADFLIRNDDAAAMGHLGAYVNAFISPSLAKSYYSYKTGRKDFCPDSQPWNQNYSRTKGAPTSPLSRFRFFVSLILLLAFGGIAGFFIAGCMVLGTLAMPTELIGYLRYTPWTASMWVFCLYAFSRLKTKTFKHIYLVILAILVLPILSSSILDFAIGIDSPHNTIPLQQLEQRPPCNIISPLWGNNYQKMFSGNLRLLQRHVPSLADATIITDPQMIPDDPKTLRPCCDGSFFVGTSYGGSLSFVDSRQSLFAENAKQQNRIKRFLAYPIIIFKIIFITFPRQIWETFHG